jgi:hypothetical protein
MNIFGGHTREDYYLGYFEEGRDYWKLIFGRQDRNKESAATRLLLVTVQPTHCLSSNSTTSPFLITLELLKINTQQAT